MEVTWRDKYFSLLRNGNKYDRKKFYSTRLALVEALKRL